MGPPFLANSRGSPVIIEGRAPIRGYSMALHLPPSPPPPPPSLFPIRLSGRWWWPRTIRSGQVVDVTLPAEG
ncbi:MAG TPA: CRISPR-associated protein Csx3 [Methanothrix sp.]|nr:CRISPR-associated protein Csx3 [Methanothrix sp.]